jgi:hypothetical protein
MLQTSHKRYVELKLASVRAIREGDSGKKGVEMLSE